MSTSFPHVYTDRLNGWKEIASFLRKGIRTAQRWERDFGLPVRRLGANGGEAVFASRAEIAAWLQSAPATLGEIEQRVDAALKRPGPHLFAQVRQ